MHPIVAAYIEGVESSLEFLRRAPSDPIVDSMRAVREMLNQPGRLEESHRILEATPLESDDPNVLILFFTLWCTVAARRGRNGELAALVNRCRALLSPQTPPEIRALVMDFEGLLAVTQGNRRRQEELQHQAIEIQKHNRRRYLLSFADLGWLLAHEGRASEIDDAFDRASRGEKGAWLKGRATLHRLFDSIETGRVQEARRFQEEMQDHPTLAAYHAVRIGTYELLLSLMSGSAPEKGPPWAEAVRRLLERRPAEALRCALGVEPGLVDFINLTLIRAELACGHGEAARRLLDQRWSRGTRTYIDDLFAARVELLAGRTAEARDHFSKLLPAIDRYRARGRLDFELRMACELSPADLLLVSSTTARKSADLPPIPETPRGIVGKSAAMASVRRWVAKFAPLEAAVLITGETGTGKELVARALHEDGPRRRHPFIAVNCGAIAESLLESELFGHERGAFTGAVRAHRGFFEQAGEGTVFLDEIGDISPRLQAALLRVLEAGEIRPVGATEPRTIACRVLAATHVELERRVMEGRFREDLMFRLKRLEIRIPSLRDRREDIVPLAEHFLNEGRREGKATLSADLKSALVRREWRGNVRELRNGVERMRLLNSDRLVYGREHLEDPAPSISGDVHSMLREGRSALRRLDRLRALFKEHGKLTRMEIVRILKISLPTATRDLKVLVREGLVRKVRPTPSPQSHYFEAEH